MNKVKVTLYVSFAALLIGLYVAGLTARSSLATAQETTVTKKQKEQGKRFKRYGSGQDLRERAVKEAGEIVVIESSPIPIDMPGRPPFINAIACDADAVVIVKIKNKSFSELTADGGFVLTSYEVVAEDIIKDNLATSLLKNNSLIISQPGGEFKLNGKSIRAIDESFKPFEENAHYILFLRYVPSTGNFDAFSNGSFQVHNDKVSPQGEGTLWQRVQGSKSAFIDLVRQATMSPCPVKVDALM